MATPAILLLVITCIAAIRGGNNDGNYLVRGSSSSADEGEGDGGDELSLEHHHSHHTSGKAHDNAEVDKSFDFYAYSMTYQPDFCKENNEKFVGCQNPNESWEGQLTIHGLWPNVSFFNSASCAIFFSTCWARHHNILIPCTTYEYSH